MNNIISNTVRYILPTFVLVMAAAGTASAQNAKNEAASTAPDYHRDVLPLLTKYCLGCHSGKEPDGDVRLDSYTALTKKSDGQSLIKSGKSAESQLIKLVERTAEPAMPPEDEPAPTKSEIAILKRWIDAGATGDDRSPHEVRLANLPDIPLKAKAIKPIFAVDVSPNGRTTAVARYQRVEIVDSRSGKTVAILDGLRGSINDLEFSADGQFLFTAGGEPGLFGELSCWNTSDWTLKNRTRGHDDSIYCVAVSPNGQSVATGGYDKEVRLWKADSLASTGVLTGHNGAVNDVEFHPNGRFLASASSDRTIKLWDTTRQERLDTFTQPEKEQYTLSFSTNGQKLAAGGVDNRIRVWSISKTGKEGTNPILFSRFAHDAPILKLAFSPKSNWLVTSAEDRFVKLWETKDFTQRSVFERQPDWSPAVAFRGKSLDFFVGRHDGTTASYKVDESIEQADVAQPLDVMSTPIGLPAPIEVASLQESEPNNRPEQATPLAIPATASGVLHSADDQADFDLYKISVIGGVSYVIETRAARMKSPADTKVEVLNMRGEKEQRLKFRAVRDSYITFRPIDSSRNDIRVKNWEEMDLNQWLYIDGEVCRIFRMPEGPDSGFRFYSIGGKRRNYFDTSGIAHALEDPCYIVEPYENNSELVDNGLPVFPLYFENDDDANRKLGTDSRLMYTSSADGECLIKVSDVRGFEGENFKYELNVRPAAPGFNASVSAKNPKIGRGSGQPFNVNLTRLDDFEGEVRIDIANVPEGLRVTSPLVVAEGHLLAEGVINVDPDAKQPMPEECKAITITASGMIHGKEVTKNVSNFGTIEVTEQPKLIAHLLPDDGTKANQYAADDIPEIIVTPGTMKTAMLQMDRHGFKGEMKFDVKNLPHGVIVDNIGLSGVLIRTGENSRQIFLNCSDWVPEQSRLVHAVTKGQGNQATRPVWIRVRRNDASKDDGKLAESADAPSNN